MNTFQNHPKYMCNIKYIICVYIIIVKYERMKI